MDTLLTPAMQDTLVRFGILFLFAPLVLLGLSALFTAWVNRRL